VHAAPVGVFWHRLGHGQQRKNASGGPLSSSAGWRAEFGDEPRFEFAGNETSKK
jgi:hypothetical protein